jgi:hypothetical protein
MRDAECVERLLLVTDRLTSSDGSRTARVASTLAGISRAWRLTLLCWDDDAENDVAQTLRTQGVEVVGGGVDVAEWLRFRRHHHTAVLATADPPSRVDTLLRETQPHATRLDASEVTTPDGAVDPRLVRRAGLRLD